MSYLSLERDLLAFEHRLRTMRAAAINDIIQNKGSNPAPARRSEHPPPADAAFSVLAREL